jgi:hypothetical protein
MVPHEGQEEFVDDRPDACGLRGFEVHEQVVAHQVERHVEHRGRDALQVDLAAVVGALVDGPPVRERLATRFDRAGERGASAQRPRGSPILHRTTV